MAGIELINVHKQYVVDERPVKVLNGISLKIPEKHITVILGRSGCGKTTLYALQGDWNRRMKGKYGMGCPIRPHLCSRSRGSCPG